MSRHKVTAKPKKTASMESRKDTLFKEIKSKSPKELDQWVDDNITDLNFTRNLLKTIIKMLKILIEKDSDFK